MLFARNFGVSSPHDTCGWHSCAECRLKLGCVRARVHAHYRVCVCAHIRTCACVCMRANARRGLFLLPFSAACISPALSAPFAPFRIRRSLALSLRRWPRTFFSRLRTKIGRLLRGERERGVENERGRWREKATESGGGRGEEERPKERSRPAERAREKSGEPRGSIGGHRPSQKYARTTTRLGYEGSLEATTLGFINIYRRTLNSSAVANENRYRV